jgi:hypothetical protein
MSCQPLRIITSTLLGVVSIGPDGVKELLIAQLPRPDESIKVTWKLIPRNGNYPSEAELKRRVEEQLRGIRAGGRRFIG